eukprot:502712-Pyramimonas_sp.AAC.2
MCVYTFQYKRACAISEELDKRKDLVRKAAREMHYEQAKMRRQIKDACYKNESALILNGRRLVSTLNSEYRLLDAYASTYIHI